jgi:hypothetical protein
VVIFWENSDNMKLTLETYGKKYSVETVYDDVNLPEYLYFFKGLLLQATFSESTVNQGIIEMAEELKE